jgi:hypothetical protein
MEWNPALGVSSCILALVLAGCSTARTADLHGTKFQPDAKGRIRATTYVSQEEFDRMTPEERERLHAAVGTSSTLGRPAEASLTEDDFRKARARANP